MDKKEILYRRFMTKEGYAYEPVDISDNSNKCDICGSTAINHTENQCGLNLTIKNHE